MESHQKLSVELGELLLLNKQVLVTAESCTGGGVASAVTDIAGSSAWFDRAFVTYSNQAKMDMLGVKSDTLDSYGAVSTETVAEMALGALQHSTATIAVSISGIAGPTGGSELKPVGTVCFGFANQAGWLEVDTQYFHGDRAAVRAQAIGYAMGTLCDYLRRI
ncbi:nicotinamide-nucleotide amidohydrolase family protein [Vibrio taketomensis]|uniref:nicotinamide-nucleotide amidohydrolase family protein n=1 Tax=Vibrio taketomensis TaxID=2572923 RepID=UPI00138A43CE|nr:nicotinamide-nucleotide amidohydrolase family protein [Vibrio taketomensis]